MHPEKKRVLIVTTVSGFVPQFEMNNVKILQSMGYEVHYAANYDMPVYTDNNDRLNGTGIIRHQIDFVRSPFSLQNIKAYHQLLRVMSEISFELVHCHTPMGSVLARLAAKKAGVPSVIYTAHGFHFFQGAPFINWCCFYPVERMLAKWTDILITINQEDYHRAKKFPVREKVEMIPGVGIDSKRPLPIYNTCLKEQLGLEKEQIIFTSVGELSKRKNHTVVIAAMKEVVRKNPNAVYLICGSGRQNDVLQKQIQELKLEKNVKLLGYRTDIQEILGITDCFIFPSLQEGLSVAVLEAMNAGLPVICSKIRGNTDLIVEGKGGFLVDSNHPAAYAEAIAKLLKTKDYRKQFGEYNKRYVQAYDRQCVAKKMEEIYHDILMREK